MRRQDARELHHGFRGVAEEGGDRGMGHRPAACAAPPVTLRVGGDKGTDLVREVHVEAFDGDVVGISIRGLDFVQIEACREEQHGFAARRHQAFHKRWSPRGWNESTRRGWVFRAGQNHDNARAP